VDDDPVIRRITGIALKSLGGFEVSVFASGVDALVAAQKNPPDIALLDVSMPELDGPEILRRLRAHPATRAVVVVFMSATTSPDDEARLKAMGAATTITKPFDPVALGGTLRRILTSRN